MLTLNADSVCDVCAEEYGPFNLPRCIPCGHVLCASCALTIIEKTSPRLQPACPFCREHFVADGVRVIRIDFSGSSGGGNANAAGAAGMGLGADGALGAKDMCIDGGAMGYMDDETVLYDVRQSRSPGSSAHTSRDPSRATSRERPSQSSAHANGIFTTINEDHPTLPPSFDANAHKDRARELEKKVAKVATKRCSAEEVQALHREIADWMSVEKVMGSSGMSSIDKEQHAALYLSNLLLRAILMNHLAHSEASRVAKGAEAQLRSRIADGELVREKLDADLRKTKNILQTRSQEVAVLKSELSRVRGEEYTERSLSAAGERMAGAVTPTRRQSLSAPTSPDSYFPSFAFSSASTAVPPASSRSNPASGANSPCSSGRTTPTAGLALGVGAQLMPMGSAFPTMGMAMGQMNNGAGMSSSSASAAARTMNMASPPRAQSTAPGAQRPGTTPTRPQSTVPGRGASVPASPTPAPQKYHVRSASMIHRSQTATPGLSLPTTASAAASSNPRERERRSMTPAPVHQRSASVAPGANGSGSASASVARTLTRSMTPNLGGSARAMANGGMKEGAAVGAGTGSGNGSSAGGASNGGASGGVVPPVPSLPAHSMLSSSGGLSRPPVPPKPRTLSQSQSASPPRTGAGSGRGVVDDRDGYLTEKEGGVRKEREKKRHERWLPSALVDRMSRPATSMG